MTGWRMTQVRDLVTWPYRVWRERISAQMIVSYLAMVLLVLILFEGTVLGSILLNPGERFFSAKQVTIDPYIGERSAAYVQWLGPERIENAISDLPLDLTALQQLNNDLRRIVTGSVPAFQAVSPASDGTAPLIVILDANGRIVASSDPRITPLTTFDQLSTVMQETIERNRALNGGQDSAWDALYSLALDNERTVAVHPIVGEDGTIIGSFVLESGAVSFSLGQTRGEFFRQISVVFLQSLWIFAIPALIVAIPFGIWRAGTISRRLERLTSAAERMARGDLNTRVRVRKHDEIGRLGESFNAMAEQLDTNDKVRKAFISNVSHELRTPVSIILGNVEQLQQVPEAHHEALQQPLRTIENEGTMLVRLVDDLFTSARLHEHTLPITFAAIDLGEQVRQVVAGIEHSAWVDRKVRVESLVADDLPPVRADAQRLQQIFSNLIYNALRHTPQGGLVVIQAEPVGTMMQISVIDTGMGMDAATAASAFDRYFQSERNKRHGDGTGLGLNIVRQLVHAHGGDIDVRSTPGEGTTFIFRIPLAV